MRLYGKSYRHRKRLADISSRNNFSHPFRPKQTSISADGDMRFGRKGIFMSLPHQAKASIPMIW